MKPISLLDTNHRRPLSVDEAQLFITLSMSDNREKVGAVFGQAVSMELELGSAGAMLLSTLSRSKFLRIDAGLAIMLVSLSGGIPGNLVLWSWTMHVIHQTRPGRVLTLLDFSDYFPLGVPSDAGYSEVWSAQKFQGANVLDLLETWKVAEHA